MNRDACVDEERARRHGAVMREHLEAECGEGTEHDDFGLADDGYDMAAVRTEAFEAGNVGVFLRSVCTRHFTIAKDDPHLAVGRQQGGKRSTEPFTFREDTLAQGQGIELSLCVRSDLPRHAAEHRLPV